MFMAAFKKVSEIKSQPKQRQTQVDFTVLYIMMWNERQTV